MQGDLRSPCRGPVSGRVLARTRIFGDGRVFPVVAFAARDAAGASTALTALRLARDRAKIFLTASCHDEGVRVLPSIATGHPLADALALLVPYYSMVESLSRMRGLDPDRPHALQKDYANPLAALSAKRARQACEFSRLKRSRSRDVSACAWAAPGSVGQDQPAQARADQAQDLQDMQRRKADVFDYIEMFCKPKRRHARNGMLSHAEFDRQQRMRREGV